MPDPVTFHRIDDDAPNTTPGAISLVRSPEGDHVKAFVKPSVGPPLPFFGCNVVFLGAGQPLPDPPALSTVYISVDGKTLYFVDESGNVLVFPITEGSILANVYYEEAVAPVSATGTGNTTMLTMAETFDPGIYLFDVMYGWAADTTGNDIIIEVLVDGVLQGQPHQQEPKDSAGATAFINTNNLHTGHKRFTADFSGGGAHTIEVRFRASAGGGTATAMFDTTIVGWNLTGLA
jgi:hypothetical protein